MKRKALLLLVFFLTSGDMAAQDERYYRQILSGELPKANIELKDQPVHHLSLFGPSYRFDLNGDGIEEVLQPQKRDGVDFLEIRDYSNRKIFESKLLAMGAESHLYKLKLVHITPKVKTLILFLDEGFTKGRKFESTARIFLLTFENNDFSTMKLVPGPHFYHEKEAQREQYWTRDYAVNVFDMDADGTREISVQYNHIQRIMKYKGFGEWDQL